MATDREPGRVEAEGQERAARARWFQASRMDPDGSLPPGLYAQAVANKRRMEAREAAARPPGSGGPVWTPLGPSAIANGQAWGAPIVTGRITALAVGPGGQRIYAGAANGGVWFSADGGERWQPLDDASCSPSKTGGLQADALSIGAIAVRFGEPDELYVGTGEPSWRGVDQPTGDAYFGIGIRHSRAGGLPGTWESEAENLVGHAILRIALDPDDPQQALAATSCGLYRRPTAGAAREWQLVMSAGFAHPRGVVSDVLVVGHGATRQVYAAFWGDTVYRSPDGETWQPLGGLRPAPPEHPGGAAEKQPPGRIVLAASESEPAILYALADNGRLYRLVGDQFQPVRGVPGALFYGGQGSYDLLLAVDPSDPATVYLGGDLVEDGDNWNLSLYKGRIREERGIFTFPFRPENDLFYDERSPSSAHVAKDPTYIGHGIHADGHAIAFATNPDGSRDGERLWIGCDGGLFYSAQGGARGSFVSRNTGLAVAEVTYLAQHPESAAVLLAGTQDNGSLRCWGSPAWYESPQGDGGGVAIDPNNPYRMMRQYTNSSLSACADGGASGDWEELNFPPARDETVLQVDAARAEDREAAFYAPIATSGPGELPTLVAFGTSRVWLSADWGEQWVTLPTGTDPYAQTPPASDQDRLDGGAVRAILFASHQRLFAATPGRVWRFDRCASADEALEACAPVGHWERTELPTTGLPARRFITALAVANAAEGTLYATLGGHGYDHVWYFDGMSWCSAGLWKEVLDIPCHAVVVDPDQPEVVYIGSDVGCWQGRRTGAASWEWRPCSQGLPEAAIQSLMIHRPSGLLRAATYGRGVWELPLPPAVSGGELDDAPGDGTAGSSAVTAAGDRIGDGPYLRLNAADSGRLAGATRPRWLQGAADPTIQGRRVYHWLSPDIRLRSGKLQGLPPLAAPVDFVRFAHGLGDFREPTLPIRPAPTPGLDRYYVQVQSRGPAIPGEAVRVLLLLTPAAIGLPCLPHDFAERLAAADPDPAWLAQSDWRFADPAMPYRTLPGRLDARTPQVVEFPVTPDAHPSCALALVCSPRAIAAPDQLVWQEPRSALLNLHLAGGGLPLTWHLDMHNPTDRPMTCELTLARSHLPGSLSLLLPALPPLTLQGFHAEHPRKWPGSLRAHLANWLSQHPKGPELDDQTRYVADDSPAPTIGGLPLPVGGRLPLALTVQLPAEARPGSRYSLDLLLRHDGQIVGGCSYLLIV